MATDVLKLFTSLGLTATESKVYLSSLGLGPTSVQEIAKKAKLSRTACYAAIEVLQTRGLMSTFERGKKKFFAAEEPENALSHFRGFVKQMEHQIDVLERSLPEVKMMAGGERPSVRFYEGEEALTALFTDAEHAGSSYVYEVCNYEDIYTHLDQKMLLKANALFVSKNVKVKILHRGKSQGKREHVQSAELPAGISDFHGDILIYANRVTFVTFVGRIVSVIIENQTLADTAKALFETAWMVSTALSPKA